MMLLAHYYLYVVNSLQQLQQWYQMTRIRKMPHRTGQGKNRRW